MQTSLIRSRFLLGVVGLSFASSALAATAPFNETFASTPADTWTTTGTAGWSVTGGYYQAAGSTTAGSFSSTVALTNVNSTTFTPGTSFTISSTFQITAGTSNAGGEFYGLALFGTPSNLTTSYYLADVQRSGSIRIVSLGSTNADFTGGTATAIGSALALNTNYTLTFTGTYTSANSLSMSFGITDANNTLLKSVTATDATALTGTNFGFRLNNNTAGSAMTAKFDNLDVAAVSAIPEPATYAAIVGLGFLALAVCVRSRRTQTGS